jgi:hypothetical protein
MRRLPARPTQNMAWLSFGDSVGKSSVRRWGDFSWQPGC